MQYHIYNVIASTCASESTLVPNGNDDDVVINYITNMDLCEDSDSHTKTEWTKSNYSSLEVSCQMISSMDFLTTGYDMTQPTHSIHVDPTDPLEAELDALLI